MVFDTKGLVDIFKSETERYHYSSGFFGDVVYDGDEEKFREEFSDLPGMIWDKMQAAILSQEDPQNELYTRFIHAVSRFKHRGFREEREVRAILSPMRESEIVEFQKADPEAYAKVKDKSVKSPLFRDGMIPYLELAPDKGALPIRKIIVGPHPDKVGRKSRLDRYLELSGLEIRTSICETPLL